MGRQVHQGLRTKETEADRTMDAVVLTCNPSIWWSSGGRCYRPARHVAVNNLALRRQNQNCWELGVTLGYIVLKGLGIWLSGENIV